MLIIIFQLSTIVQGSFLKVLLATITGLFVITSLGIGARVFGAHLSKTKVHSQENFKFRTSENNTGHIYSTNIDVVCAFFYLFTFSSSTYFEDYRPFVLHTLPGDYFL